MGGDDDRVHGRLELGHRVAHCGVRIGLDDEAVGGDPLLPQRGERSVEPAAGRRAARVLVDDEAALRLTHGTDDGDAQLGLTAVPLDRLDQLAAGDRLVGDDQQMHQRTWTSVAAGRSPFRTA